MTFKLKNKNTPIRRVSMSDGVLGKANRDGTIDINNKVSDPDQIDEIIAHESIHIDQMDRGDLDYDDTNVYWKGKKYSRSDMEEGAKNLPWEKEAYNKADQNQFGNHEKRGPLHMNKNFKLKGYRGQSEPMSALSKRGLVKEPTIRVKINPRKEGELSQYAVDHTVKNKKNGKVVLNVPKSEMWSEKSDLFKKEYDTEVDKKGNTYYKTSDPAAQPTAKGFKKDRRRGKILNLGITPPKGNEYKQ